MRKVSQNTVILLAVHIVLAIFGFAMAVLLGRSLGEAGFGQYSFVLAWLLSLTLFAEFGLSTVLTRDLAADESAMATYLVSSLICKAVLSLPAAGLLLLFAPWLALNPHTIPALRWGV